MVYADRLNIGDKDSVVILDRQGNFTEVATSSKSAILPLKNTLYEIDGEICDFQEVSVDAFNTALSLKLSMRSFSGKLMICSQARSVRVRLRPEGESAPKSVGMVLSFPLETEFHLPEAYNLGRRIDRTMPVGEQYSAQLDYNFFLTNLNDEEGKFQGWQTGEKIWGGNYPPSRPLKFRSGKTGIYSSKGLKSFTFETVYVPDTCEALETLWDLEYEFSVKTQGRV